MFTKEKILQICDDRGISHKQHRDIFVEGYQCGYVEGWQAAFDTLTKLLGKQSIPDVETR